MSFCCPACMGTYVRWLGTPLVMQNESQPEMKYCGRCREDKPIQQFHRSRDGRQPWCKPCKREYAAAHYQANKARRRAQNKRRQVEFMRWYVNLKVGHACADCGREFHTAAMQWDHLPGSKKEADLAMLARRGSRQRVLDEIAKCELVCANCHAIRTYLRRDSAQKKASGLTTRESRHLSKRRVRTVGYSQAPVAQVDRARDF